MRQLYFRCNDGHYFRSAPACPFDGWSCPGLERAIRAFEALLRTGTPSVDGLKKLGVPADVIRRVLLIEFGDESSAFEALVPERYLHGGRELQAHEVGRELL